MFSSRLFLFWIDDCDAFFSRLLKSILIPADAIVLLIGGIAGIEGGSPTILFATPVAV
jgi:hypothetical protein